MSAHSAPRSGPGARRLIAVIVLVPLLAALALWAFAWPAARTAPHDLPIGLAGPAKATAPLEQKLTRQEGAFEIHHYADEAAARDAIKDRTVYGAVVVTAGGPKLLTASAASPLVAQLLQQKVAAQAAGDSGVVAEGRKAEKAKTSETSETSETAEKVKKTEKAGEAAKGAKAAKASQAKQAKAITKVTTVDVVASSPKDPRGAALSGSVLPLALAGMAAGAVVTLLGLRGARAVTALVGAAALVGLVGAGIADSWLGVITGDWWAEAAAFGLSTLAVSAAVAGLAALVGSAGIGFMSGVVMLIGNPASGASSAPQLLPEPLGAIGQWLPPGAGATLLRSVSYFDGAAATTPALTLTWWAALGLGAVLVGSALRNRVRAEEQAPERPVLALAD
ncbi:ABC transporter permease [Streptomyces sp. NPDC086787]|uniref:ABC transporter permease n=1 Tax=Streptomyces sp. NPDC086787 TaxID=3365759 RepID=UPI003800B82B